MSGRVKKEVEETDLIKPQPFHEENRKYVEDGDGKQKSPMETTAKRLKIKRRYSDSKLKFVISGHAGKCICCRQNRAPVERSNTVGETRSSALIRAEEVQSNLEPAFPSFVKSLVRSHVASCFWMGLPGQFCRAHLPHVDATVTLQDECGKEFKMKYIAYKTGLSAGWRQFCVAHRLFEGDVLVFQLIESCTFKVYVIRANDLTEVDGALGLLNLDAQIKQNIAGKLDNAERGTTACKSSKRKRPRSLPLAIVQKKNKKSGQPRPSVLQAGPSAEQSENDSEEVGSEVLEGFKLSLPAVQFRDIKSFEDFNILVDGLLLDSELSEDIRNKYYKLCCSQNAFLHDNLIKGVNLKLIAGIISETVNIADAMRACTLNTSRDEFATWDKALKASELFGMNVGFLRAKLGLLLSLAFDSEGATKTRRYIEARFKRVRTEDEIRNLEAKLVELKETYERYGADVERLKSKAEGYELKFQEQVLAPW
ncbi:B3 domain-containing protein [Populus alba x Populus x berolinensis]|uniref:B3 domain-containing protein n=1 Tax=Populus alba x Populus x berolinensis TaxID=444605 RepID=A0AAD6QGY6_9ROSI|nr:B3 domain-containing protein [Populus alba x Populus x berolinensis]